MLLKFCKPNNHTLGPRDLSEHPVGSEYPVAIVILRRARKSARGYSMEGSAGEELLIDL